MMLVETWICDECGKKFTNEDEGQEHEDFCRRRDVSFEDLFRTLSDAIRLLNIFPSFKQDGTANKSEMVGLAMTACTTMEAICKRLIVEEHGATPGDEFCSVLRDLLERYRADAGEECYQDDPAAIAARDLLERMESHV